MGCRYIPVPKEETYILIKQAQQGDDGAKTRLVMENTGLVKKIAAKFISEDHELEDLIQIGYIGLLRAVEKFDPAFDVMFSTYAVPMIMGEIKRFFRDNGKIKVSRALKTDLYALRQMQNDFETREGRPPRISEIAEALSMEGERVLEILEAGDRLANIDSLDRRQEEGKNYSEAAFYSSERETDFIMMKDEIRALHEKERVVILLRYYKDLTQQQIANRMGISQVQVSRIEKHAIQKIREKMAAK